MMRTSAAIIQGRPVLFKDLFDQFLDHRKKELALSTYQNYRTVYNHVIGKIGSYSLQMINGQVLDDILDGLELSLSSRKTYQRILTAVFNDALRQELISKNPCSTMRKVRNNKFKVNFQLPALAEIQVYIRKARMENNYFIYKILLLAVSTGMRLGEILNLKRKDLDLKDGCINIRGQITNAGADMPLKTSTSYRRIFVQTDILKEIAAYTAGEYVFTPNSFPDRQISRRTADKYIYRFFKSLNTPEGFTFHSLRHYHATELLKRGISLKEVSKRLGHASVNITGDIYTHWLDEMDKAAAEVLGKELLA